MTQLLQNWITEQAQRHPDAVAVVMQDQSLTYGELEESTNRLARLLQAAGCQRGDRVCFAIPKSPAAIIAIAGILKADCIHVPIDTTSPAPRVSKIIRSSDPRYILGVESSSGLLEELFLQAELRDSVRVGWMEASPYEHRNFSPSFRWTDVGGYSPEPLESKQGSHDPAHILFTSGSTGEPKGVVITHANVIHFVEWAVRYFGIDASDRVSCHPPLHFDLSVFDIFGAFAAGAQLHLVPPKLALLPNKLAEFIHNSELTQWFSVPSVLNYMAKFDVVKTNDFPALRRLLWCGEVFPTPALVYWMKRLPHVSFTNLYGPTETTIASSYYTVESCPSDGAQPIPIGTACEGEELLVLDDDLRPAPAGELGNLYIRGVGLSPGYWRNPAATETAFIPYEKTDRIYRTGDLARTGSDGLVYFAGRADTQIKSRGYRIELGEIEVALHDLPELKECAVVALPTDGFETSLICCAYVGRDESVTPPSIRGQLSRVLPSYMVPSHWMVLPQLPKNGNGKIDRRKVQELFAIEVQASRVAEREAPPSNEKNELLDAGAGVVQPTPALDPR
ncbi:MAG: amino acid adenylation domain-containing protein [Terriglobales bacterium]